MIRWNWKQINYHKMTYFFKMQYDTIQNFWKKVGVI